MYPLSRTGWLEDAKEHWSGSRAGEAFALDDAVLQPRVLVEGRLRVSAELEDFADLALVMVQLGFLPQHSTELPLCHNQLTDFVTT